MFVTFWQTTLIIFINYEKKGKKPTNLILFFSHLLWCRVPPDSLDFVEDLTLFKSWHNFFQYGLTNPSNLSYLYLFQQIPFKWPIRKIRNSVIDVCPRLWPIWKTLRFEMFSIYSVYNMFSKKSILFRDGGYRLSTVSIHRQNHIEKLLKTYL